MATHLARGGAPVTRWGGLACCLLGKGQKTGFQCEGQGFSEGWRPSFSGGLIAQLCCSLLQARAFWAGWLHEPHNQNAPPFTGHADQFYYFTITLTLHACPTSSPYLNNSIFKKYLNISRWNMTMNVDIVPSCVVLTRKRKNHVLVLLLLLLLDLLFGKNCI